MEYAVLGGGALGLMTAYRLLQAGHSVMLFEQEPLAGGLASGFQVGDTWLEKFYHHIFRSDKTIIKIIEEIGLRERLEWLRPRTVSLIQGKLHQLDSPLTLLRFKPLRFDERLRMGVVAAFLKVARPEWLEGQTADPWLRRWMGKRAYETVFQPLFQGKFGKLYDQIALPWFWARFHDRTTELGYLRGGFQLLYDRLAELIVASGGKLLLETRVEQVEQQDGRWQVRTSQGAWTFDGVISTLPTRLTFRLIPALPEAYRKRYDWGLAYGAHCLILALDRRLTDDSYWINICDPGYPFMALVEHTNYRSPAEYGGRHLIYLGNYRAMDDPLFTMKKEEVLAAFLPHLQRLVPAFQPEWVTESWMFQAPYAQPIVTTDYREHIPPLETPLAGLWMANMFQVYPHDRGQNYSFELAEKLVKRILQQ
ncbi:protoporphyrinogen oxidase [Thermosporothrix hazakensis]|jgi:protoporphyrinogen oxidase|uniref:Protoporphyrinogen oxidase n=1 Tax=Thermosporothrix hazakensis TaxID=644383 RepID=A0A326U4D8_THEHA|nr:NAD(P)/FAD-dependent oxidoreductase [Thermosporothrix hazakensis]PZW25717.1 protoporphyrinogen oxidase [Thermosporothrix hazakensis]GCE48212.1 oxidoreductase [Thermosporothrix hazakensis]